MLAERNDPGCHRVDRDLRREGLSKRTCQHNDSSFRRAVMRVIPPRPQPAQRTDIHNTPPLARQHPPRRLLAAEKRRLQIDIVNRIPIGLRDFQGIDASEARGIVHQTVNASLVLVHKGYDFPHLIYCGRYYLISFVLNVLMSQDVATERRD